MFKIIFVLSLISSTYSITCPTGSQESFADWGNDLRFYYMMRDPHCVVSSVTSYYPVSYHAKQGSSYTCLAPNCYWYSGKCCYRDKHEAGQVCTSTDILDNYYLPSKQKTVSEKDKQASPDTTNNDAGPVDGISSDLDSGVDLQGINL